MPHTQRKRVIAHREPDRTKQRSRVQWTLDNGIATQIRVEAARLNVEPSRIVEMLADKHLPRISR